MGVFGLVVVVVLVAVFLFEVGYLVGLVHGISLAKEQEEFRKERERVRAARQHIDQVLRED